MTRDELTPAPLSFLRRLVKLLALDVRLVTWEATEVLGEVKRMVFRRILLFSRVWVLERLRGTLEGLLVLRGRDLGPIEFVCLALRRLPWRLRAVEVWVRELVLAIVLRTA